MTKTLPALLLAALLLAGCEGQGEHNPPDERGDDAPQTGPTALDSAATGTAVPVAPPPQGALSTLPPDSNPSPTTPSASGAGTATGPDSAAAQGGTRP
jgi:PBP1b-binding outer membrane lipoprotein LpoB